MTRQPLRSMTAEPGAQPRSPEKPIEAERARVLQGPAGDRQRAVLDREAGMKKALRECKAEKVRTPSGAWTTGKIREHKVNADSLAVKACHRWAAAAAVAEEDKGEGK